ncbi:MAG: response regulator [Candidatus Krumholzibacteriaceae bacterium]|jgi:signal transduction histidine kinase/DNA-binding response OmpR family regulator
MPQKALHASGSVLIVDDEASILEILDQFLTERGYRVVTAQTAGAALIEAEQESFDVALIDLKLPDRTGLDLIEPIERANPNVECIMMTAFASLESTIEALRMNVFNYILKPFDLLKIGEAVDAAAEHARMKSKNEGVLERVMRENRRLEESTKDLNEQLLAINDQLSKTNDSLNRHVTRLRVLYQMGRDISSNENWSDALDRFLMALCKYLEAEGAGLLLFSNNEELLNVRTSYQIDGALLEKAVGALIAAQRNDTLRSEMFTLESCGGPRVKACLEMTARWESTVVPLLYKGRWLGFLLIRKVYRSRKAYLNDYHFINTIQTILTEEVANAVNISRLRNLKDFNETVIENINSGVLTTDRDGRVIFLNGRGRELLGQRSGEELFLDALFSNPFGSGGLFEHLLARGGGNSSFECTLQRPGCPSMPVRLNTTTVKLDDHHGSTVVGIFEDLTARKEMEEELRRADRLRSLGELSAGVAHEIRNPLTGIATTAQVLKERLGGDEEKGRFVAVILDEIARLDDIIKNLLNFARPVSPRPTEIALSGLIEDALGLLADTARGRGVSLHFENRLRDDRVLLDGDQIKQVLLNIALNGIEASPAGGRLNVCAREAADPAFIEIELADTGGGVPDEIADKLYNPFFTTKPEGTGMGLSISRKIAESHGGRIYHRSVPGRGTSFFIELPRKTLVRAERAAVPATE